jgi:hypothetical protein
LVTGAALSWGNEAAGSTWRVLRLGVAIGSSMSVGASSSSSSSPFSRFRRSILEEQLGLHGRTRDATIVAAIGLATRLVL